MTGSDKSKKKGSGRKLYFVFISGMNSGDTLFLLGVVVRPSGSAGVVEQPSCHERVSFLIHSPRVSTDPNSFTQLSAPNIY